MKIIKDSINVRKYRKKLKSEIDNYLKKRNHLHKIKTTETSAV